jgi:hypothetical protein
VIAIGDLHIYQNDGMEEYIPKKVYYGNAGRIQSFLDSMSDWLYPVNTLKLKEFKVI